jgi:hypothetical protein
MQKHGGISKPIFWYTVSSYPDFTVGQGITPCQPLARVAGFLVFQESPPVGNLTLPRKHTFFVSHYSICIVKINSIAKIIQLIQDS